MRNRLLMWIPVLLSVFVLSLPALGEAEPAPQQQTQARPAATGKFNPRDFTGYWIRRGPRPNDPPPLTPAGIKAMEGRIPDYKAKFPTDQNDPMYSCNPQGFPRLVWEENEPIEMINLEGRILQLFQWERTLREIWLDGRTLPTGERLDNIGPNWYGHSVAQWEGDVLVVRSTGFNDKAWLDEYAHPISFDAVITERYQMIDADTIEGEVTINDPKNFTAPWTHQPKSQFRRMRPDAVEFFEWKGLFSGVTDAICAPMLVEGDYNKRIRDPSVFGDTK
jgi:hypothetical protein